MKNKQLRYFKSYLIPEIIGGVIFLIGLLINRYAFEIRIIGRPIMVVGAAVILVCLALRVSDNNYQEFFTLKLNELPKIPELEAEIEYEAKAYSFENTHFAKNDKTGTPRSEIFVRTLIYFDKQLHIVRGIANMETDEVEKKVFSFDSATASAEDIEIKVNDLTKKVSVMTITGADGSACHFPVKYNDIEIDQLIEKLNKRYGA